MSIERPNLADAFTKRPPANRAAALTGLLPPPARPTAVPPLPAEDDSLVETTAGTDVVPEPAPARAAEKTTRPASRPAQSGPEKRQQSLSEQATVVTNVAVYLEPDLLALARERRRSTGLSYDELTVEAFDTITDHQLAHALRPEPATTGTSGMPTRQRRPRGTAGIQIQLRLDTNQRAWIEQKQQTVGAPSRSALVATALRLHLTT